MAFMRRLLSSPLFCMVLELLIWYALASLLGGVLLFFHLGTSWLISGLVGLITILMTFLLSALYIERVSPGQMLQRLGLPIAPDILPGFVGGSMYIGAVILIMELMGWYQVQSFKPNAWGDIVLQGFISFFFVAVIEESVFRGIIFRLLEQNLGSWIALAISALLFGAVHQWNPEATWMSSLAIALEAGLLLGAVYMLTRSLWTAIGLHWAWNFFESTIFGTQVSGINKPSLIQAVTNGPVLWTGGSFGPEAGLIAVILGVLVAAAILWLAVHSGQVIEPSWKRSREEQSTLQT